MMDTILENIAFELKMSKNIDSFKSFEEWCHSSDKNITWLEIYDFYF